MWLLHRNLWKRSNTTFLREWTDKLFKIFCSSDLYFQEAKRITNKSSSESLFLEIVPNGQINLWNRAYFIHHLLGNSLGQQIKGPENPCETHLINLSFKPVFPQNYFTIEPSLPCDIYGHPKKPRFLRTHCGKCWPQVFFFPLNCMNSSQLQLWDQFKKTVKHDIFVKVYDAHLVLFLTAAGYIRSSLVFCGLSSCF